MGRIRPRWKTTIKSSILVLFLFAVTGCSTLGAQPWQRDLLAKQQMQLDPDPLDSAFDAHIYFSKEASSGGAGFGGGGCGCN
ncbi:MAG: DUF4266 domain-containing protein [Candidatus Krumholzibacteriia bacterium]